MTFEKYYNEHALASKLEECVKECCDSQITFRIDNHCILSIYPQVKCQYMSSKYGEYCTEGVRYKCLKDVK